LRTAAAAAATAAPPDNQIDVKIKRKSILIATSFFSSSFSVPSLMMQPNQIPSPSFPLRILWKLPIFHHATNIIFQKNPLKETQNPSRYYYNSYN
jgi:hypothetical protein